MQLYFFAQFHAAPGNELALEAALNKVAIPSRTETGCRQFHAFRSSRDQARFVIHSVWADEAAFDHHATLPHTVEFLATVDGLVDRPPDLCRTEMIL
ncbi:antibiotic biosynthesis monooxygenase [Bradyrhizobium jicamae]|uniref:Antibiotic biosynthesis monooxygenase n=1 Tax=Bradyrhizobium jicamae TaxID=280332 RepID=A0ABS5FN51_9BRAD|nr:putative quinol monooxygenase [Bradyrhizobium jicamae]MBR0798205.1 antibiotic biosynthesis monooxygenase [Bradyrhizobium jicamae]MBR0936467.1 antibiotic biosynthesis monooxygenase [Bradyrhizobium jicamae]